MEGRGGSGWGRVMGRKGRGGVVLIGECDGEEGEGCMGVGGEWRGCTEWGRACGCGRGMWW